MPSDRPLRITLRNWCVRPFTNEVAHRVVRDEELERGDEAATDTRQEPLRHHGRERRRELHADLRLAFGREHVGDAIERLRRVVGVQRGEHEVTGLGERQRELNRLRVAHLADEDDVGVFPQRRSEGAGERLRVDTDFPLVDRGDPMLVRVFDRVLDGEDVHRTAHVDVLDHATRGLSTCPIRSGR